jgi:hypothetical protein
MYAGTSPNGEKEYLLRKASQLGWLGFLLQEFWRLCEVVGHTTTPVDFFPLPLL